MSFSDPSLWAIRYLQSFNSANIGLYYPAIPAFDTPNFSDRFLRIRITSSTARDNWSFAGRANQIINAGGVDSVVDKKSFRLNDSTIWEIKGFYDYRLTIKLPTYFKQATVSIFGYTGSI